MDNRMDVQNLFEHIKFISEEAAHILRETVPYGPDILTLTMEDLNELLPGECNFQLRRQIMGLIDVFLQEQAGQSMDSIPADVMKAVPYDQDILSFTMEDLNELLPGERNFQVRSHIMGLINVFLQEQARQSMDSIPADVMKAVPYDPDILTSTKEDLNKLLPGERNSQSHIMGLIHAFLQEQAGQSMGSSPADVINVAPEVPQSMVLCTKSDKKEQQMASLDTNEPNITDEKNLPGKDTDPAEKESEPVAMMTVSGTQHSSAPSGEIETHQTRQHFSSLQLSNFGHAPEVLQSNADHTSVDMEEKPMAAQDGKRSYITNNSKLHWEGTEPVDKKSESGHRKNVSPMEHSTGPSEVKVHVLVTGETFCTHDTFMKKLNLQIKLCSPKSCSIILVFCPVISHIRTDMEAAMARVTENKPVILVFMHHCHHPSHMTNITVQPSRSNIVQVVHCAFHESKGLLECQENKQAVNAVRSALLRYK